MEADPKKREERPARGARLQIVDLERPKDTPDGTDLEAAVASFAAVSEAGAEWEVVLPDGASYYMTRTEAGVWTEPWDEALRAKRTIPEADSQRFRVAVAKSRIDAARFLVTNGDAEDRRLAARFLFGVPRRAT